MTKRERRGVLLLGITRGERNTGEFLICADACRVRRYGARRGAGRRSRITPAAVPGVGLDDEHHSKNVVSVDFFSGFGFREGNLCDSESWPLIG